MKTIQLLLACAALTTLNLHLSTAFAQSTAFTYQGVLSQSGAAVNGSNDLTFTLYDAAGGGNTVGSSNVVSDLVMTNGLFTVTLDFGASAFNGSARWLQIAVRPGASTGAYTNLVPRQPISATPYALFAAGANASTLIGSIPATALSGTYSLAVTLNNSGNVFAGNGSNLTALNASQLTGGAVPATALSNAWKLGGNTGANPVNGIFLGTTDNQPLEFKVNNQRGLRLEYASGSSVNVIGGHNGNFVNNGIAGATIAGGGSASGTNQVLSGFGTIAGGLMNTAGTGSGQTAPTVGGGENNTASGTYTTVGGGNQNVASGFDTTVSGGKGNSAGGTDTTVGGGRFNTANAAYSTVPGGFGNAASGNYSFAAGRQAQATNDGTFIWADSTAGNFGSTANNQFLIRAAGGVAIGTNDPAGAALRVVGNLKADSFLGMGSTLTLGTTDNQPLELKVNNQRGLRLEYADDTVEQSVNVIGGYHGNSINNGAVGATIAGGGAYSLGGELTNRVINDFGTVGGGFLNTAGGDSSTVPGGARNNAMGRFSFAAGLRANANHDGTFVWSDSTGTDFASTGSNQFLIRASGGVAIGTNDPAGAALRVAGSIKATSYLGMGSTLTLGTTDNQPLEFMVNGVRALRFEPTVFPDQVNVIGGSSFNSVVVATRGATIGGGGEHNAPNQVAGHFGTVGGGEGNTADFAATVGGGENNTASGGGATVAGGKNNTASGGGATVAGGEGNIASSSWATVGGGKQNSASGNYAFAAGHRAKAIHNGAFVWADSTDADFASTANDQFLIRASGGVGITGNETISGNTTVSGDTSISGNTTIAGGLRVDSSGVNNGAVFGMPALTFGASGSGEGIASKRTAGTNQFGLDFYTGYSARMSIANNGNVGIGTTLPTRGKLEIIDGASYTTSANAVALNGPVAFVVNVGAYHATASLYASGDIVAGHAVISESDRRIKQIRGTSDSAQDLATLLGIEVTDYMLKDTIAHGTRPQKKVIAQQVEKVFPQVVSCFTNAVPDIYQLAPIQEGWVQLATDLKVGERVKLIDNTKPGIHEVLEVRPGAFRTDCKPAADKIFVYGREVPDFRTVDYEGIAMLNVSATQELEAKQRELRAEKDKQIGELKAENAELKARLEKLEQLVTQKLNGVAQ